jgi:glycosyltransferase involved in cell wall biosynthesis
VLRVAWFTPWPPQRSGIAGRSAELVPILAKRGHAIDVFLDDRDAVLAPLISCAPDHGPGPGDVRPQSAHDFVWRQQLRQYDLCVYHIGNSRLHEFIWPYLFRWPGLVVLHDARLHHARARALLLNERFDDYRAEFAWNHVSIGPDPAELGVRGFDGVYYYQWPMRRAVVESARLVACHSRGATEELRAEFPGRPIEYVALGEGPMTFDLESARQRIRTRLAIPGNAVVFGVFGALTRDKRLPEILRSFAATRASVPDLRLLLAGLPDRRLDLEAQIAALALGDAVHRLQPDNDDEFDAAIAAADVSLNLRWPTALETSGPWVRSLALSRATVIVDLVHQQHVPVLDPRTWRRHAPCEDVSPGADADAVAVAIDILDEEHSLRLAMRRLATDRPLRETLGRRARQFWEREHTVERMAGDCERLMAQALRQPMPVADLPSHLRPDPASFARQVAQPFDVDLSIFDTGS